MPISQARMEALIAEAWAWKDHAEAIIAAIEAEAARSPAVQDLNAMIQAIQRPPAEAMSVERYHFRQFSKRNEYNRARLRRKRADLPHVDTSPQSLAAGPQHRDEVPLSPLDIAQRIHRLQKDGTETIIDSDPKAAKPEDAEDLG